MNIDYRLLLALNGSDSIFCDSVMWDISRIGLWLPLYAILVIVVWRNNKWREAMFIYLAIAVTILMADQIASGVMKPYFHRLRPTHDPLIGDMIDTVRDYRGGLYGFCSSHASNTFALATFMTLLMRHLWLSVSLFGWASVCSYSRMYLGVHFPSDILCGALLGVACALFVYGTLVFIKSYLPSTTGYYSSAFTSTGYQRHDILWPILTLFLTIIYTLFHAAFSVFL